MLKLILNFIVLISILFFSPLVCIARGQETSLSEIKAQNARLFQEAHARNEFVLAVPPYWGRNATRIGFEKFSCYLAELLNKKSPPGNPFGL